MSAKGGGQLFHECPNFFLSLWPGSAPTAQRAHEVAIAEGICAEAGRSDLGMSLEKPFHVLEKRSHETGYRCAATHRQGVLQRTSRSHGDLCDTTHMQEPDEKVEEVREALRRMMERKGMKPKPLAKRAGLGDTSVRDLLDNVGRDIKISTLQKLAGALEVNVSDLLGESGVPLTGRVGAGGSIVFDPIDGETMPRPPGGAGELEALEVVGDSMLPRYSSGDIVYISRVHDGLVPESIGDYCAVRLTSGESYIKLLARGSKPGLWTLRSLNAADIEDVELEWATPILFVLSSAARRRLGY